MSQLQKRSGRCMIVISVYGVLPLSTYLYRLNFTLQLQNWCTSPSLIIARGVKLGSRLIASELAFVLDVLTIAKVALNYIPQILNFFEKICRLFERIVCNLEHKFLLRYPLIGELYHRTLKLHS